MDSIDTSAVQRFAAQTLPVWGGRVAGVLFVLFAAWIVAGWARRMMLRSFGRAKFDATLSRFFSNMVRYAILVFAVLGCLGVFGIETTSFAAVIAAGGLAVGLAFQGTLSNFAAGVMLLVFRPFKAGDVVKVAGEIGSVAEIELFTTEMTTADNRRLVIPNAQIFGSVIENITHHPTRRVEVEVGTAYDADIDRTREVLEAVVKATPKMIDDPAPQVLLAGLGASSVDWKLRVWCKTEDFWDVFEGLLRRSKLGLDRPRSAFPFRRRTSTWTSRWSPPWPALRRARSRPRSGGSRLGQEGRTGSRRGGRHSSRHSVSVTSSLSQNQSQGFSLQGEKHRDMHPRLGS